MADSRPNPETRSDVDLERAVLGACIFGGESLQYVADNVRAEDLSTQAHRTLHQHFLDMYGAGRSVDRNTLISSLSVAGTLAQVGGEAYVRSLESAVPFGSFDLPSYCGILRDFTIGRKLIALGDQIKNQAMSGTRSQDVLTQAETYLRSLGEYSDDKGNLLDTSELVERAGGMDNLLSPWRGQKGLSTGLADLNSAIGGGLRKTELTVIGANTSRGKSVLAAQIAYNVAIDGDLVAYFSYEMLGDQLIRRLVSARQNIPYVDIRNDQLLADQKARAEQGVSLIADSGLHICDIRGRNIVQVAAEVRRLEARKKQKVQLVVLDHVQLMRGRRNNYSNRNSELTEISGDLAEYTLEKKVAVIALSQLNRDNQKRKDGRPEIGDLRESGSLEQDSSNVWLIHRPEYFDRNNPLLRNQATLILGKQRDGEVRDIELRWNGMYMRFDPVNQEAA